MNDPRPTSVIGESVVVVIEAFLEWVNRHRSPDIVKQELIRLALRDINADIGDYFAERHLRSYRISNAIEASGFRALAHEHRRRLGLPDDSQGPSDRDQLDTLEARYEAHLVDDANAFEEDTVEGEIENEETVPELLSPCSRPLRKVTPVFKTASGSQSGITHAGGRTMQQLLSRGRDIGIEVDSDGPALSDVLKVRVRAGSEAAIAGIRSGDRITATILFPRLKDFNFQRVSSWVKTGPGFPPALRALFQHRY